MATRAATAHTGLVHQLGCVVERIGTRLLVRVRGELNRTTAVRLRATLLKCLVEQPDAVVVDLSRTVVAERVALSVFTVVSRQASLWPDTPLFICGADARATDWLAAGHSRLSTFPTTDEAMEAEPRRRTTCISDILLPVVGSAQRARNIAVHACIRWEIPDLAAPASLVVSELVSNAVLHAGTMADLRLTRGHRYLMIAVRDGSFAPPRLPPLDPDNPETAHGLHLVDVLAQRWGVLPAEGGKVVWATLAQP